MKREVEDKGERLSKEKIQVSEEVVMDQRAEKEEHFETGEEKGLMQMMIILRFSGRKLREFSLSLIVL